MFKSRRAVAPPQETVKVAEVVKAYYDAGRRPTPRWTPPPETFEVAAPEETAESVPEPESEAHLEVEPEPEPEPVPVLVAQGAPMQRTLEELAEELEAFIEVIRYGDDLGGRSARN